MCVCVCASVYISIWFKIINSLPRLPPKRYSCQKVSLYLDSNIIFKKVIRVHILFPQDLQLLEMFEFFSYIPEEALPHRRNAWVQLVFFLWQLCKEKKKEIKIICFLRIQTAEIDPTHTKFLISTQVVTTFTITDSSWIKNTSTHGMVVQLPPYQTTRFYQWRINAWTEKRYSPNYSWIKLCQVLYNMGFQLTSLTAA